MSTQKAIKVFVKLIRYPLALVAAFSCQEVRDWSRCNETTTDCLAGFVCDVESARCVPVVNSDAGSLDAPPISVDVPPGVPPIRCTDSGGCPAAVPSCGPEGLCVECVGTASCKDPARPFCVSGACRGCQGAGANACEGATPACDATSGRCVQCTDGATHCTGDPSKFFCVANSCAGCALAGADACQGATPVCDAVNGRCVQCTIAAAHCTADLSKAFCTDNVCVGCQGAGVGACKAPTPVCAPGGRCVECTSSADCGEAGQPICDGATSTCVPCATDAQCLAKGGGPGVCMFHQNRRCATDAETIYVQRTSSCASAVASTAGTSEIPYCTAQLGVNAVTSAKRVVVLRGPDPLSSIEFATVGAQVTIFGQGGAALEPGGTGPGIRTTAGDVYIRSLAVRRGAFEGIVAEAGSIIRLNRCVIENNSRGGILLNGAGFDITNTVIAVNGPGDTPGLGIWGGIGLIPPPPGVPARLVNATIVGNPSGIACSAPLVGDVAGLIVAKNTVIQIGSACMIPSCCTGDPLLSPTYRLTQGSPCIDKLPANMSAPDDIDGEARPRGPASDCGADEF